MAIELTRQQQAAVDDRGGDLLVSAAAGSGKTRVLVERLMGYVEQGADIDRFLVITFTNAAAAELRDRIAAAIHARLARRPGDRHLRRNSTLVYKAPICTIDSFCLDLLRQWGHLADLDPDFRLCDEAEAEELRARAMEEVLEARYANIRNDAPFAALVDALAGERDDQTLEDVVLFVHKQVQAQADPEGWLRSRKRDFALPEGIGPEDTPWGRALLADGWELADYWLKTMKDLRDEIYFDELLNQNYTPSLEETIDGLERLRDALNEGWDDAAECFPVPFPRPGGKRKGNTDPALKERMAALRKRCKAQMTELGERFGVTADQAMEDLRAVGPAMTALLDVAAEFGAAFLKQKRRRRLIDFNDGEHLAVRLLADSDGSPTDLAQDVGKQFVEIMVDEYQDTNAVQNAIFGALSNGENLFMVGDVKQSIYRFRLAEPGIFLEKYGRFAPAEAARRGEGRKILLSDNFRSRPEVLEGVNFIFRNVMTRAAGELDYTGDEALRPGRSGLSPDGRYCVELDCVDLSTLADGGEEGKTSKDLVCARAAARRIRDLLDSGPPIGDRPVRAEDIVILLRAVKPVLRHYAAALDELGVPWSAEGGGEFFGTTEISVAVALLQVLDNPRQDVALLAALRSPLFNFTPDRLARLRAGAEGTVYDCLTAGAERGEEDCVSFLALLSELRELAAEESSHRLLWYIYGKLDVPAVFAAMPDGQRRRANLMALYDEACRFESGGHQGLMAFLLHLSRMMENDVSVPVPGSETGGVRLLTIHRSKGLEFPVVLVCGLDKQFNETDARTTVLFHPELGLGPKRTDRERGLRYTTIARDAVALRIRRQTRAEEMRLLYVAMTRAEHKLILFSAVNGRGGALSGLAGQAQCPPPPRQMAEARTMADWVLTPALCRGDSGPLWADLDIPRPPRPENEGYPWDIRLLSGADFERPQGLGGGESAQTGEAVRLPAGLVERLSWRYLHESAAAIASKLTATQLKGREKDAEAAENAVELRPAAPQATRLQPPVFEGQRPLTPAQKGTALHMVMQYLNYDCTNSMEEISGEIARLVAGQYITPQQGEAVNPLDILAFFCSDLGTRLRNSPRVEREFKFSLLAPAADYYPEAEQGEEVLLQGVVDCWFVEADGAVTVVDFKTDRVNESTVSARAEGYRPQLDAYTRALSQAAGVAVRRRCLWFFSVGHAVEL